MFFADDREDFTTLELTILSKKQFQSRKWNLNSHFLSKSRLPSALSSITELKYSDQLSLYSPFREGDQSILHKRGMVPYSNTGYCHLGHRLTVSVLNEILKRTKNLKSLFLESESNFKGIRKIRGLQDLSLKIKTEQVLAYPQLLSHLTSLQKVELYLKWSFTEKETEIISKFFGFVLNLPKLRRLTVWLSEGGDYYKVLLRAIYEKKLPSLEIIVLNFVVSKILSIDWTNYIDTLYFGLMPSAALHGLSSNKWPASEKPEKILRFGNSFYFNEEDFKNGSTTIKNLAATYLFYDPQNYSIEDTTSLLTFISQIKALENLTLSLEPDLLKSSDMISNFLQQLSLTKSVENLMSFTFQLNDGRGVLLKVPPPYGSKMKNLKNLHLILYGHWANFSDWTGALKGLVSLERFYFVFLDLKREGKGDLNFPFEALQNLKLIDLYYGDPFVESSIDKLVQSISKVKNLESLEVSGRIFYDLDRKKAEAFVKDLCLKENLETANFIWKEAKVMIQRVNGKLVVSSERNRGRK